MPFEVKLSPVDYKRQILFHRKGSCSPKHYFLGSVYTAMGAEVVYLTYPFFWKDLEVAYPPLLSGLTIKMPVTNHLAIKIKIGTEWFFLDATWDLPLGRVGFPVNNIDRLRNTKNAVNPYGNPVVHRTISERINFVRVFLGTPTASEVEFYAALNDWLNEVRRT
jgi:hypothetical protein